VNKIENIHNSHILLLQGPVGLFFKKLDKQFRNKGAKTYRIGLNAGDEFFSYRDNYTPYRDIPENWHLFIKEFFIKNHINKLFLFGDCRFYQSIAIQIARELNIEVFVFEEGYIRPYYITLERQGVNDYSLLSRDPQFYHKLKPIKLDEPIDATPNGISNWSIVITYYFVAKLFIWRYKHYKHHRNFSALQEFFFGTRSLIRKIFYTRRDKKYLDVIENELSKKYFFVPLQTHNDFQILQHSHYGSIEKFIIEVLESFAKYADTSMLLIFKHHPIDRGRKNYKTFIHEQASELNIEQRILVVHDLFLPSCLKHAKGTITINSTVGLSSIEYKTPTIVLGNAIYDMKGLTNIDKTLREFWKNPEKPDHKLYMRFRQHLIQTTQLNGSFYGLMPKELK